ncbi:MAG: hypothetical protein ABSC24_11730, partial [Verrucomicrobiota bacterium]
QLSYMGTLKSLIRPDTSKDKKPLPLPSFLSKIRGATGSLTFYGPDALQTSNSTRPVNRFFN